MRMDETQLPTGHEHAGHEHAGHGDAGHGDSTWSTAVSATLHCLTGCAIGEVLGMVLATWWGWSTWPSVILEQGPPAQVLGDPREERTRQFLRRVL